MATNDQVVSRVAIKAMVHVVPAPVDKNKVRSRGPKPSGKLTKELVITCSLSEWTKRWAAALDVLQNGVQKAAPPKAPPAPPPLKMEAKKVPPAKKAAPKSK